MRPIPRLICFLAGFAILTSAHSQILFRYGNSAVTSQEFLRAFLKNNNEAKPTEKALREYLELYIRFKLKVKAAQELRLDTLATQQAEWREFRKQVASAYLSDTASFQRLVGEAFHQSQKDIHLGHIYVPFGPNAVADTVRAWKQAMDAYHELEKGTDFGNVAAIYSADSSVVENKGDIGFITAFTLPYALENLAYSLQPGKFSLPFHGRSGYHIFKHLGERAAVGRIRAAQILLAFRLDMSEEEKKILASRADSICLAIEKGADFAALAAKYSYDNASFGNGGELAEFGVGEYQPDFENAILELPSTAACSKPIKTALGYHIVKRLALIPVNLDPANEGAMALLEDKVRTDGQRMLTSRKKLLASVATAAGLKKSAYNSNQLFAYAADVLAGRQPAANAGIGPNTLLFTIREHQYRAADWIDYLKNTLEGESASAEGYRLLLDEYTDSITLAFYSDHLENFNPGFAAQMTDFREGNLLFEIMQRNVWDRAAADTLGLRAFYDANKGRYWWQPGADAILFTAIDSVTAREAWLFLSKDASRRPLIATAFEGRLQADSGRFEMAQLAPFDAGQLKTGMLTTPVRNAGENSGYSFLYILKPYPDKAARSFGEAKGYVLNDYQQFLEDKWVASLKKKYPVQVNEPVLQSLWKK